MAYQATVHRLLIASPSDVADERRAIPEIIHQWNRDNAFALKTVLEPVKWETHCTPEMGDRPQEIVNRQVVRDCDILVGVFWTRLGSPTGKAESGTVEEIREFIAAGKPVMLYFSNVPAALADVDVEQWQRLRSFQSECQSKGLVYTYETLDELRDLLRSHLGRTVQQLSAESNNTQHLQPPPEAVQVSAIQSFSAEFLAFLRRSAAAWEAERDSDPHSTDDGKYVLGRVADELLEYRSRITQDSGQLSNLLADVAKRIKALQRHQVFLDGGVSFREFWQEGDDVLFLLEIVPALLRDAIENGKAEERESLIRAAVEELRFNQPHLVSLQYGTAPMLRIEHLQALLNATLLLPRRLLASLRAYRQNIQAARELHQTTTGGGDSTPELAKVEQLLQDARSSGEGSLRDLATFCHYRYGDQFASAQGAL